MKSLFERIGGEAAIMTAVDLFYRKVVLDETTRPFFETLEMEQLTRKQIAFMAWAFGGPSIYKGRDLREAHHKLVRDRGLSDVHFDAVLKHLRDTLVEMQIAPGEIDEALAIIGQTRNDVLGRSA